MPLNAANLISDETLKTLWNYWNNYSGPEDGNGMGYAVAGSIVMLANGRKSTETPAYDSFIWMHNKRSFDQFLHDEAEFQADMCDDGAPMQKVWDEAVTWLRARIDKVQQ